MRIVWVYRFRGVVIFKRNPKTSVFIVALSQVDRVFESNLLHVAPDITRRFPRARYQAANEGITRPLVGGRTREQLSLPTSGGTSRAATASPEGTAKCSAPLARMPDSPEDAPSAESASNAVQEDGGAGDAGDGAGEGGARMQAQAQVGVGLMMTSS